MEVEKPPLRFWVRVKLLGSLSFRAADSAYSPEFGAPGAGHQVCFSSLQGTTMS